MGTPLIDPHRELHPKDPPPTEYAIGGSYEGDFIPWMRHDIRRRAAVRFLDSRERAERLIAAGAPKGVLHRLKGWQHSPARELAERLEATPGR